MCATSVGHAAAINAGEFISATGLWTTDREHGVQFKAAQVTTTRPTTLEGIEKYLGSGMIRGIGPVYARALVQAFGEQVFDLIEQEPERLREVTGIGAKRAARVVAGWAEQKAVREIMLFLHAHGVGTSRAVRLFKTTARKLQPERRLDQPGFHLDQLGRRPGQLGHRQAAMALSRRLGQAKRQPGAHPDHRRLLNPELCRHQVRGAEADAADVAGEAVGVLADQRDGVLAGDLVADTVDGEACVFLAGLYRSEQAIAGRLRTLSEGLPPWPAIDPARAIPWVEGKTGLVLAPSQAAALRRAVAAKALVITGGPGVGKTTLVNSILKVLAAKGVEVALCAPTGRAAKRLAESTGLEARTMHRLLEADPKTGGFKRGEAHPLGCNLLVVDECSMVDVPLMRSLLQALPDRAALLLVGDADQLPSVGPGQVLADVIASGAVPVIRLTEVFRQAAASRIITNAHRINQGQMPELTAPEGSDFFFVDAIEPEDTARKLLSVVSSRIPARFGLDPVRDVQVLCPMNRGSLGARTLNIELQRALNPPGPERVERFGWTFCPGDKVMQVTNDYDRDVFNGDLGIVTAIDAEEGALTVSFEGRAVEYGFGELDELVLAYATTIHKAQGSEYPVVVIPLATQHYAMLARNLLYTGVTRGKRQVIVGSRKALAMAVRGGARRRWSKLREWLRPATAGRSAERLTTLARAAENL